MSKCTLHENPPSDNLESRLLKAFRSLVRDSAKERQICWMERAARIEEKVQARAKEFQESEGVSFSEALELVEEEIHATWNRRLEAS